LRAVAEASTPSAPPRPIISSIEDLTTIAARTVETVACSTERLGGTTDAEHVVLDVDRDHPRRSLVATATEVEVADPESRKFLEYTSGAGAQTGWPSARSAFRRHAP